MQEEKKAERNLPRKKLAANQFFKCSYSRNLRQQGKIWLRIGSRFARKAVVRNKYKRWVREIFRKMNFEGRFDVYVSLIKQPEADFHFFSGHLLELYEKVK
ncbi:MAG: ribonuclease P protein component [bacterium]